MARRVVPALVVAVSALAATLLPGVVPAVAAVEGDWASWAPPQGGRGAWSTTATLPGLGGPVVAVTSTSTTAELGSGGSTWFGAASPPGAVYGSSRSQRYLTLRPAERAAPSRTTYTFSEPPAVGWGFVLGDVDADQVTVSATTVSGEPVDAAGIGFRGPFNVCGTTPRPSGLCPAGALPDDQPSWDADTLTLTGNPGADDTDGASGWFQPQVPVRTVTLTYARRAGSPVFQTWLAGQTRAVLGRVSGPPGCDPTTATVVLADGDRVLARVAPAPDGSVVVERVAARAGLVLRLADAPDGCVAGTPRSYDVAAGAVDDDGAVFEVTQAASVEVDVTATLLDDAGDPVAGAAVELTGPAGSEQPDTERVVTGADGGLEVSLVPGEYAATLTPPPGYAVADPEVTVVVPPAGGAVDLGFAVTAVPVPTPSTPTGSPAPTPTPRPSPTPTTPGTTVAPGDQAGPTTGGGELPSTGGPGSGLLVGGALVLASGAALTVAGVRRRP